MACSSTLRLVSSGLGDGDCETLLIAPKRVFDIPAPHEGQAKRQRHYLRPFLGPDAQPPGNAPDDALAWQARSLRNLLPADLELDLSVGRWLGLPVRIDDAKLALRADVRRLRAPLSATIAGAGVSGRLDLDTAASTPTLALQLVAREVALGGLARRLAEVEGIEGTLGRAGLRLAREFGGIYTLDLYAGVVVAGKLRVENAAGRQIREEDFDTSPIVGANLTVRF